MKKSILLILLCVFLYGSAVSQERQSFSGDNFFEPDAVDSTGNLIIGDLPVDRLDAMRLFPARGGDVDWGLALSGGGIRSGYFNIGVMKALYDTKLLDDIDVISTVSGGGYASYWLYTNYNQLGKSKKFGETAFADSQFIRNVCGMQAKEKANFVPTISLLRIIFGRRSRGFDRYRLAIEKTFGNNESSDTSLDFLDDEIKDEKVPYFIINTTLRLKKDEHSNPSRRLFEITPGYRGNPDLGFADWTNDNRLSLSEAIASSAAPKWKIAHPIDNYPPKVVKKNNLYLSDGGHSENLAALALIRRGVKNIIIVDAEEDATYEFAGYRILQKLLRDQNIKINLQVDDIEKFLKDFKSCEKKKDKWRGIECREKNKMYNLKEIYPYSVSVGTATSVPGKNEPSQAKISSRIYYVKMTLPKELFPNGVVKPEAGSIGEKLHRDREKMRLDKKNPGCANISFDFNAEKGLYEELYKYRVPLYAYEINHPRFSETPYLWSKMQFFSAMSKIHPFFTYKFPHITTIDQSFFSNQAEAFVGLGYLQAAKLTPDKSEMK